MHIIDEVVPTKWAVECFRKEALQGRWVTWNIKYSLQDATDYADHLLTEQFLEEYWVRIVVLDGVAILTTKEE